MFDVPVYVHISDIFYVCFRLEDNGNVSIECLLAGLVGMTVSVESVKPEDAAYRYEELIAREFKVVTKG